MVETHPEMQIFGMTAYTVRDRGTSYERDMANPETEELFSGRIESRYDLCDAMIDGVLPKPIYKSAYTNLIGLESQLEEKVQKLGATTKEYQEYMAILTDVKRKIHEAPSIPNILKKSIKPNGKYIYFCPPCSEDGTNDIEIIKKQAVEWFKQFVPEEDIVIYTSTSDMGQDGKLNRNAFYDDISLDGEKVDNKLRIMFAINQYNEGIHAPNIDGVIMGRGTTSDIVYFEQLGRALSVRGNTKDKFDELEQYSVEQLIDMCKEKYIPIKDNSCKEDLIEKLIAPVVIDLTNNFDFIKELENNLRDRIKNIEANGLGNHRQIKIRDVSFDIEIENQDLFEMLRYVMDRMTMTWEDKYELARLYYEHYGNLEIPQSFKTVNGYDYDENGVALGSWIGTQRSVYNGTMKGIKLTDKQINLLEKIGMIWNIYDNNWNKNYQLAKAYYEHYGNLEVPESFKTLDGITENENGVALGRWIATQRRSYNGKLKFKIVTERIELLKKIGMKFIKNKKDDDWITKYELAKIYYEHHGNLNMKRNFKTLDGITENENGVALGMWIYSQIKALEGKNTIKTTPERLKLLRKLGILENKSLRNDKWMNNYRLAKIYYEHYGNLEIPRDFKTLDGITEVENGVALGRWIGTQRYAYTGKTDTKISDEQIRLLEEIGINWMDTKVDEKFQQEQITSENLKMKKKELQNRFYSVLNNYDNESLPTREEINQNFIDGLNIPKKR